MSSPSWIISAKDTYAHRFLSWCQCKTQENFFLQMADMQQE
ncbi:unnamed protein product [Amoebophrya sp. A25]|nr:unnamed protein product [Amoebophrya sp. A25]|eukprot:GSA25T00014404001.1